MPLSEIIFSLLTLTLLEVVLGIDNLIFISVVSNNLPDHQRQYARKFGLVLALFLRLALLASIAWITKLTTPLITLAEYSFSTRDLLLISGGLFLIYKGTQQIQNEVEAINSDISTPPKSTLSSVIIQIGLFDLVFSLDSVFTAVGMVQAYWIMATAIIIAICAMIFASNPLAEFVERHPTVKMLAFSFLLLVGVMLIADGFQTHIPRGYLYFAICYAVGVEALNTIVRKRHKKGTEALP